MFPRIFDIIACMMSKQVVRMIEKMVTRWEEESYISKFQATLLRNDLQTYVKSMRRRFLKWVWSGAILLGILIIILSWLVRLIL